ncbi:MAG: hypothetical protein GY932_14420 [Arcobacter sp.]|nr:hypothetical protein [Arcobacter sp.]
MKINSVDYTKSMYSLNNWITKNGWQGYDPYDIKSLNWVISLVNLGNKNKFFEIVREVIFELFYIFPTFLRKIFFVKTETNAKAMALFSRSYLDLYSIFKEPKFLENSKYCIDWLEKNKSEGHKGSSWGYPFNWQTKELIPKHTPNGIVTTAAGDAFWSWYKFSNDQHYLSVCKTICVFLETLPIHRISGDQICFSYTPVYVNHVHNLNLFVAEFLIKVGIETNQKEWINLGKQAVNYTIGNQFQDGSFDYNGPPEKPRNFIDNYHTAFVLRMLHSIWILTKDKTVFESLEKCYNHYVNNFFEKNKIPKLLPTRKYRIDIHSCAESINCLCELSSTFSDSIKLAERIADWTISNLQSPKGYFYYGYIKSRIFRKPFLSKVSYIRWNQAWMLKGLSNLLIKSKQKV